MLTGPPLTTQLASSEDPQQPQSSSQPEAEPQQSHADSAGQLLIARPDSPKPADAEGATEESVRDPAHIQLNLTGSNKDLDDQQPGQRSSSSSSSHGAWQCPLDYPEVTRHGVNMEGQQPYLLGGNATNCVHCKSSGFISQVRVIQIVRPLC